MFMMMHLTGLTFHGTTIYETVYLNLYKWAKNPKAEFLTGFSVLPVSHLSGNTLRRKMHRILALLVWGRGALQWKIKLNNKSLEV